MTFDKKNRIVRCPGYSSLQMCFKTVHAAKGLEEDYVILINADDNKTGFPNKLEDDPLLGLVLSNKSEYEFSEERRLFYVALTRARQQTFILCPGGAKSSFVAEIEPRCKVIDDIDPSPEGEVILCPKCYSGHLILHPSANESSFLGCSNYPYCDYTINDITAASQNRRCPICGDFLVARKSARGWFWAVTVTPHAITHVHIAKNTTEKIPVYLFCFGGWRYGQGLSQVGS